MTAVPDLLWRPGPERDDARKINPSLVAWNELPESGKEWNRSTGRGLSPTLALAGFRIFRVGTEGEVSS